ncbi:unnamed protein product [Calypogeia fissa]
MEFTRNEGPVETFHPEKSFTTFKTYGRAMLSTGKRFQQRAFAKSSVSEEMGTLVRRSEKTMKRNLGSWDIFWLTIGSVIGAGVFIHTGTEAHEIAGPAIIISYASAGFAAILAALNYTEFAVEIPVAGGAFAYLRVEFGELVAFIGAGNILLQYVIGGAAVARSWTGYFAALIDVSTSDLRIHVESLANCFNNLDPLAVVILLATMIIAIWSTKWTSILNWVATLANMLIIAFVVLVGMAKSKPWNFTHSNDDALDDGFAPYGAHGIFEAASVVFFAYTGFDAVTTMAEETQNPGRNIPLALVGAMVLTTIVYVLMTLTLTLMVPYGDIHDEAPFTYAFEYVGIRWAKYLIAVIALKGITTVILVGTVGQARYLTHIARTHMVSSWFAKVNPYTQTPINATATMVFLSCLLALFSDLMVLRNLLSLSTLFVFALVAMALLVRRYYDPVKTTRHELIIFVSSLGVVIASSIGIALYWASQRYVHHGHGRVGYTIAVPFWICGTAAIQVFCPQRNRPKMWGVPMMPWVSTFTIAVMIFLLGSLDADSFYRFAVCTGGMICYYLFIGLHASYDAAVNVAMETDVVKGVDSEWSDLDRTSSIPSAEGRVHPVQTESSPDVSLQNERCRLSNL